MIYHLVTSLEARVSHLSDRVLLMERLLGRDDRGVRGEREVDAREADRMERVRDRDMTQQKPNLRNEVSLELIKIDVQGTVKAKAGSNRADDLGNQAVEMLVAGTRNIEIATTDVIHSLVVNQKSTI